MRGCLFTLLIGAVVIALFVVIGLPAVAAGMVTAGVSAAGLQADDTTVTVSSDPPTDLLGMHADRVRIVATDATFRGMDIGSLDLSLGDMALLDRTAATVDGRLEDVVVADVAGSPLALDVIRLGGGGDTITATATVPGDEVSGLIADAVEGRLGARPSSVRLVAPDRLEIDLGVTVDGRLLVTESGDLAVRITDGPAEGEQATIIAAGGDLPIRITGVRVTDAGDLRLNGELAVGLFG